MTRVVTSATNPTVKLLAGLRLRKYREESGLFLAEGTRTALEALSSGAVPRILAYAPDVAETESVRALRDACLAKGGLCLEVTASILGKITRKDNPQKLVAAYDGQIAPLAALRPEPGAVVVALDRVRDPGNLGTMLRTADAVAAQAVVLVGECCDPHAAESVRASMGSIFNVPLFASDEAAFIDFARAWPGTVVGTAATAPAHYRGAAYAGAVLAVLGSEQSGLSAGLAASCGRMVHIPILGKPESLNLAVAGGILLYGIRELQTKP